MHAFFILMLTELWVHFVVVFIYNFNIIIKLHV